MPPESFSLEIHILYFQQLAHRKRQTTLACSAAELSVVAETVTVQVGWTTATHSPDNQLTLAPKPELGRTHDRCR